MKLLIRAPGFRTGGIGRFSAGTCSSVISSLPAYNDLFARASNPAVRDWVIDLRRRMHANPELLYNEFDTSALIQSELRLLGVRYTPGWAINTRPERYNGPGGTGIVAEVGKGAPCVLLRADMDALPLTEETEVGFRSENTGIMHACGHDAHTAMLLGAAKLLSDAAGAGELPKGTVRLMFQPAEEGGAGAKRMVSCLGVS